MRIRTKVEFSGVPAGTEGMAELDKDDRLYKVTWDVLSRMRFKPDGSRQPLVDWFTREEFNQYLEVLA